MTDYYTRSNYTSTDFNYSRENVYKSDYENYGEDLTFMVKPSTRYSSLGEYIFEVGDWRETDSLHFWSADFYAGNTDPRPGTPIRTVSLGYKKGQYSMRFAPSIPLGKNLNQQDLEYTFYIMPNFGDQQSYSYNPNQACGLRQGGLQMTEWTTFPEFHDFFTLNSSCDKEKLEEYISMYPQTTAYFASVVVR